MTTLKPLPMLLACLAFLVMRLGGAHLHHCFDGSEPGNAVHFADAGLHHSAAGDRMADASGHGADGAPHHDDLDTGVASDPLGKLSPPEPTALIGLLLAVMLLPRLSTPRRRRQPSSGGRRAHPTFGRRCAARPCSPSPDPNAPGGLIRRA
ncbi:hypothetical protein [Nevskia sp.]|uniref:hypothetical protein n=1 Tax=Nevskia sp. TaxID=1929292 RepID=UPI003F72B7CE